MDSALQNKVVLAATVAAAAMATAGYYLMSKERKQWKKVGRVSKLYIYPVKSTSPLEVDQFYCHKFGPAATKTSGFDRGFFIVKEDGQMVTARQDSRLLLMKIQIHPEHIIISYEGKKDLKVAIPTKANKTVFCRLWKKDVLGIDCGAEASDWMSHILLDESSSTNYKLVYYPHFVAGHESYQRHMVTQEGSFVAAYQDCSPFNILSESSVADLNPKLDLKVSERNFRPNILVTGCGAYAEDTWKDVKINDIEFRHLMRTGRCLLTTINPDTGVKAKDIQPLKTLRRYRKGTPAEQDLFGSSAPMFGCHICTNMPGKISVGDDIFACV